MQGHRHLQLSVGELRLEEAQIIEVKEYQEYVLESRENQQLA